MHYGVLGDEIEPRFIALVATLLATIVSDGPQYKSGKIDAKQKAA